MRTAILIAAALAILPPAALAAKGHVHGAAALDASLEREQMVLSLELPLDAATGFERAPKTPQEKAMLDETARYLNDAVRVFSPSPDAQCSIHSVLVRVPFLDGKAKADDHADIAASYVFRCARPAALKSVETTLFRQFRRLYRIEVQQVGPNGQRASRMAPKQPTLNW